MAVSRSPEISVWPSPPSLRALSRWTSMRSSASPRAGGHSISRMEALPFRIERDCVGDRCAALNAEMVHADRFAHPRLAVLDEAKRDRAAKARTHVARRDIALR